MAAYSVVLSEAKDLHVQILRFAQDDRLRLGRMTTTPTATAATTR
jgi:hypothetical protein